MKVIRKYLAQCRADGIGVGTRALVTRIHKSIYSTRIANFYSLTSLPFDRIVPEGYDLELREIPEGDSIPYDPEIAPSPRTIQNRYAQGARCYGAIWEGRIIDYFWSASNGSFHETSEGFTLTLGPR
jgi:hypothetical protein